MHVVVLKNAARSTRLSRATGTGAQSMSCLIAFLAGGMIFTRLVTMFFEVCFKTLQVFTIYPYDLVLTKRGSLLYSITFL